MEETIKNTWSSALKSYVRETNNDSMETLFSEKLYHMLKLDHQIYNGEHFVYNKMLKENPIDGLAGVNWQKNTQP